MNKKPLFVIGTILLLGFIFLYNYITITSGNWFLHPDERDVYTVSQSLYEKHSLIQHQSLNSFFPDNIFTPEGSTSKGDDILPGRSIGIYVLLAPFYSLGSKVPFLIIPICGLISLSFIYLILRRSYNDRVATLATTLFAFTPHFIYWNNMLFSNIPALMFFLGGVYFLMVAGRKQYLAALFFGLAVIMRYEYILIVVLFILGVLIAKFRSTGLIKITRTSLLSAALFLIFVSQILIVNKFIYGSPLSFGYTQTAFDPLTQKQINYSLSGAKGPLGVLHKYIYRFGNQFTSKSYFSNILINSRLYIMAWVPIIVVIGLLGLVRFRGRILNDSFLMGSLLVAVFILLYFGGAGGFNGFGEGWLGHSYSRYFLLPVLLLCILTALLLDSVFAKRDWSSIILIIVGTSLISIYWAFNAPLGLKDNDKANSLPTNSVIISNFYAKAIISRPVLVPELEHVKPEKINTTTLNYTDTLLNSGYKVFIIENLKHKSFLNLYSSYSKDRRFKIINTDSDRSSYEVIKK
jgi:hypothetical protein